MSGLETVAGSEENRMGTRYELETALQDLIDKALNELSPEEFNMFIDTASEIIADYEVNNSGV